MKSAKEWTNELDQDARQSGFYKACLYAVKKIQAEARAATLEWAADYLDANSKNFIPAQKFAGHAAETFRNLATNPAPKRKHD